MRFLEVKVPPPIAASLIAVSTTSAVSLVGTIYFPSPMRFAVGGVFALLGFAVVVQGMLSFRRAKTTINPVKPDAASAIVTDGVYRFTRNPMYVGLTCILIGWAVLLTVPWAFLGPVLFVLYLTRFQIIPEERILSAKFGREYEEYRARVRRWL